MIKNMINHFITITKHKWRVFKLCIRAGIPWRGLVHDLSKYSPTEFFESAKYYQGDKSPIPECKRENGYSKAWLHHKGRNRHHGAYWYDPAAPDPTPVIPYPYVIEMICDGVAAGMVYNGKNWNNGTQLKYWEEHEKKEARLNERVKKVLTEVYIQVSEKGIEKTIYAKNLKQIYQRHCEK